MRKFILVATLVLVSATAQAGITRGPTLASSDGPAATARAAEEAKLSGRQRPSMRYQSRQRMQQQQALAARHGHAPRFGLLKARGRSVLSRIKFALHRRGIY
jgi:hypothetical protein